MVAIVRSAQLQEAYDFAIARERALPMVLRPEVKVESAILPRYRCTACGAIFWTAGEANSHLECADTRSLWNLILHWRKRRHAAERRKEKE